MFCRVCGFRVRVWVSCRTARSFGYGYGSDSEITEVPGGYKTCCTRTPGMVGRGVQNSQKFRVRVWMPYRTHKSSGYGYESLNRTSRSYGYFGTGVQISQKLRVRVWMSQKFFVRVVYGCCTEPAEIPGSGNTCEGFWSMHPVVPQRLALAAVRLTT